MVAPTPLTSHRVKYPPGTCTHHPCSPSTKDKRCGQAKRSEEGEFGALPRLWQSNSPTRTYKRGQAVCSGQAEHSGEREFGGLLRLRHHAERPRAEESQAHWQGRAQRWRSGGLPRLRQSNSHARRRRPSRARRPDRAQWRRGGSGVSPDYDYPPRTRNKE
jgi:hypothetical protein